MVVALGLLSHTLVSRVVDSASSPSNETNDNGTVNYGRARGEEPTAVDNVVL